MHASRARLDTNDFGSALSGCLATGKPSVSSALHITPLSIVFYQGKSRRKNTLAMRPKDRFAIVAIDDCYDASNRGFLDRVSERRKDTQVPLKHVRYAFITPKRMHPSLTILLIRFTLYQGVEMLTFDSGR